MRCKLSQSDSIVLRKLVVDAGIPGTEIFVIDAAGNLVDRAVKRFDKELPSALYKIRYQIGDRVVDQLVELPPGEGEYYAKVPELPIVSAAPLTGMDFEWDWAKLAEQQSRAVQLTRGSGGFLFIFVIADRRPDIPARPSAGLTLHTFSGEMVADFADAQTKAGYSGCSLELDPGNYLLRAIIDFGNPVEQTVVIVEGWQTQVYVRLAHRAQGAPGIPAVPEAPDEKEPSGTWGFDLSDMGIILVRGNSQSLPSPTEMRWTAAARQCLAAGRGNAAPNRDMMGALLSGKFENPMFGIYAGHLLALQEQPDLTLLREVYENLSRLIGHHPDVTALLIRLSDPRAHDLLYPEPPMLRASWSLVVNASTPQRDLRPQRSYSERIAASLWGSGAWLSWRTPPPEPAVVNPSADHLQVLAQEAVSGKLGPQLDSLAASVERQKELSPTERLLAAYLHAMNKRRNLVNELTADGDRSNFLGGYYYPFIRRYLRDSDLQRQTKETIAHDSSLDKVALFSGLPSSMVLNAASTLADKLGVKVGKSKWGPFRFN
jgi:hypothetical protein